MRKRRRTTPLSARRRKTPLAKRRKQTSRPKIVLTEKQSQELWGTLFGLLSAFLISTFLGVLGVFGVSFSAFLLFIFGIGAYILPILFGVLSLSFFFSQKIQMNFTRSVGILFLIVGGLGLIHILRIPLEMSAETLQEGGGFLGSAISTLLRQYVGDVGGVLAMVGLVVVGSIFTFPFSLFGAVHSLVQMIPYVSFDSERPKKETKSGKKKTPAPHTQDDSEEKETKRRLQKAKEEALRLEQERKEAEKRRQEFSQKKIVQKDVSPEDEKKPLITEVGEWEFPSLELLSDDKMVILSDEKEINQKELLIQEKLAEFNIGSDRGPAHTGPTVTQFTIKPHEGVKITKITGLKNDLALALSTPSLRLEAPIPGKNLIGIEIPNKKRATVHLREILESTQFEKIESPLRLAMGRDVTGGAVVSDLGGMPHLLIAGATGSGKSVGMNTFLMSLLYQNSPADLKFIMIDPKRVELTLYNGIPHLLTPVITEADKALASLQWSVAEMMRRYGELAKKGYRNVSEYNAKETEKMPKIVIVIDELADLMMRQLKKDTEAAICRLAQMARAVGMHLIVATQRPSVDVITGLIKANIPTRIAFAVTSAVDSRTILDSIGAEVLLGKGDMLFSSPDISKPKRIQGIYTSTEEVSRVTNRLKITDQPDYDDSIIVGNGGEGEGGDFELSQGGGDINQQAIEIIRATGKASASLLQRKLSVGYARAARILDELEEQGVIGPSRGSKPREVYL